MHVYDIEDALEQGEAVGLRHAFRVLARFPHDGRIEGAKTAAKLIELFQSVTLALELDQAAMPETLCQTIEKFTRIPIESTATYAHGAMIASEYGELWRAMFLAGVGASRAETVPS